MEMASTARHSTGLAKQRDINGNDIVILDLKKCEGKLHGGNIPPKSVGGRPPRRQLRKRRSSLSLECETHTCKRSGVLDRSFPVDQPPRSADKKQSPGTALGNFIANVFITRRRSQSCSSGSSSSCSSDSEVQEEIIRPTQVCEEEATHMYQALVRNPLTNVRWSVSYLLSGQPIEVSYNAGQYDLFAWNLGSGQFVFGFRGSGSTYYVRAPSSGGEYLTLTSGGDPANITTPSNDQRCFYYHYSNSSGSYLLSPSQNTSLYVRLDNGFATTTNSVLNATSWDVSDA